MQIIFDNVQLRYGEKTALHPLSVELNEQRIGVVGLNGSGKSSFARLINGLVTPSAGRILVDRQDVATDLASIRQRVGYIFQNPQNQIILPIVRDDIALGLQAGRLSKADIALRTDQVLDRLSITELGSRRAHELSGGELQLAALAAVLVTEPRLLILDEPTNQLDIRNRNRVCRVMQTLPQQVIAITHDLALLDGFDRVLLFHEGRLERDGPPTEVIAHYKAIAG